MKTILLIFYFIVIYLFLKILFERIIIFEFINYDFRFFIVKLECDLIYNKYITLITNFSQKALEFLITTSHDHFFDKKQKKN